MSANNIADYIICKQGKNQAKNILTLFTISSSSALIMTPTIVTCDISTRWWCWDGHESGNFYCHGYKIYSRISRTKLPGILISQGPITTKCGLSRNAAKLLISQKETKGM